MQTLAMLPSQGHSETFTDIQAYNFHDTLASYVVHVLLLFAFSLLRSRTNRIPYSATFWQGKCLMDTDLSNICWKIFWRMITVFHHTPINAVMILKIWQVKFWQSSWESSKMSKFSLVKIFPSQNVTLYSTTTYL